MACPILLLGKQHSQRRANGQLAGSHGGDVGVQRSEAQPASSDNQIIAEPGVVICARAVFPPGASAPQGYELPVCLVQQRGSLSLAVLGDWLLRDNCDTWRGGRLVVSQDIRNRRPQRARKPSTGF